MLAHGEAGEIGVNPSCCRDRSQARDPVPSLEVLGATRLRRAPARG
ncbi:hypothetical protein [Actinomyces sp. 186855]|nr:hypothetical protein [Actinomyces sp. 186855]